MGLITLGKNFCHWTISVVIAGHLAKTKNKIWRTFWSILLIITIIAFCLHCTMNIIEYLAYEKTTVIRLYSLSSAPFPAVTICNLNPFKQSALNQSVSLSNLISAYKYTLDKKATSEDSASTVPPVPNVRKKRQACAKSGQASVKAPSQSDTQQYSTTGCMQTYNVTYGLCGDPALTITLVNINKTEFTDNQDNIEKGVYLCFHDNFCDLRCNAWPTGLEALANFTDCAEEEFNYPPKTGGFNFMAMIAESYSSFCSKADKNCDLGLYKKPSTKYVGNYWYSDCKYSTSGGDFNYINMTMEGCGDDMTYTRTAIPTPGMCNNYIKPISDAFSNALDETDCGTTCGIKCPYASQLCDLNQNGLCQFYKNCTTTTTEETMVTLTTEATTKQTSTSKATTIKSTTKSNPASSSRLTTTTDEAPKTTKKPEQTTTEQQAVEETTLTSSEGSEATTDVSSTTALTTKVTFLISHSTTAHSTIVHQTSTTSDDFTGSTTSKITSISSTDTPITTTSVPTSSVLTTTSSASVTSVSSTTVKPSRTSTSILKSTKSYSSTTMFSSAASKTNSASSTTGTQTSPFSTTTVRKTSTKETSNTFTTTPTKQTSSSTSQRVPVTTTPSSSLVTSKTTVKSTSGTRSSAALTNTHTTVGSSFASKSSSSTAITSATSAATTSKSSTTPLKTTRSQTNPSSLTSTKTFLNTFQTTTVQPTSKRSDASAITSTSSLSVKTSQRSTKNVPITQNNIATTRSNTEATDMLTKLTTAGNDNSNSNLETTQNVIITTSNSLTSTAPESISSTLKLVDDTSSVSISITGTTSSATASKTSQTPAENVASSTHFSPVDPKTTTMVTLSSSMTSSSPLSEDILMSSTSAARSSSIPVTIITTKKSSADVSIESPITKITTLLFNTSPVYSSVTKGLSTLPATAYLPISTTVDTLTKKTSTTNDESTSNTSKDPVSGGNSTQTFVTNSAAIFNTTVKTSTKQISTKNSTISHTTKTSAKASSFANIVETTKKPSSLSHSGSTTVRSPLTSTSTIKSSKKTTLLNSPTTSLQTTKLTSAFPLLNASFSPTSISSLISTAKQSTNQVTSKAISTPTPGAVNLDDLSKIYKLNSSQAGITIETNAQQALITIAASLSDAEKQALGYKMTDLIQTCIIDGVPCNVERDFLQTFDVDYGYCYTFNYEVFYNTTQMGTNHGLKMVILSDINEYLATSSEQGIKVVVHYQEQTPFPNVDGYRSATGKAIDLRVTYGIVSRLDAPYGECNNLDKLKELNQPFYFPGTYTVEGCYRSCFQQKLSKACNCSDPRFPLPTDLSTIFCKNTDTEGYACYEKYIHENGDYYNVEDCSCAIPCDDITYDASIYYSNWPYGTYFYQALCTNSTLLNGSDCQQYYRNNGVLVQVSYARLGYESIEETPVNSAFDLFNNLAGNTGLWIGFTAVTAAELLLIFIQICLWICTKHTELKEVPSCRRRNYTAEGDLDDVSDMASGATITAGTLGTVARNAGIYSPFQKPFSNGGFHGNDNFTQLFQPKNFANDIRKRHNSHGPMVRDSSSMFEPVKPVNHIDEYDSQLVTPTPVQSAVNESATEI